jgi:hypothetical protein
MTQIVLEGGIVEKLLQVTGPVQLCASSGQLLGEFRPHSEQFGKLPPDFEYPFTEEELDTARSDPRRYTTDQVLHHLKSPGCTL